MQAAKAKADEFAAGAVSEAAFMIYVRDMQMMVTLNMMTSMVRSLAR